MDAGTVFILIAALGAGGALASWLFRMGSKVREKEDRALYYRRLSRTLKNAQSHFERTLPLLAEIPGMDEIPARQALEDAKFASRGLIAYGPEDFHRITDAEAERMLRLTTELHAVDATIAECQEAAMAGSNRLPVLHEDLMARIGRIVAESKALDARFRPKTVNYFWSS
ncbi:MAG: hypothetical protein ACFBSD_03155 [Paracoccaceae bacterium]